MVGLSDSQIKMKEKEEWWVSTAGLCDPERRAHFVHFAHCLLCLSHSAVVSAVVNHETREGKRVERGNCDFTAVHRGDQGSVCIALFW